jgi:hypothetical protein
MITMETDSLLVLRGQKSRRAWCPQCSAEAEMISLDEVGVVSNLPLAEVEAWIESSDLHQIGTAGGAVLICLNSMIKRVRRTREGESAFRCSPVANEKTQIKEKEKP